MTQATVHLGTGFKTAIQARHHTWYADETIGDGGEDAYPTPFEQMVGSLGACIAVTTKLYAQRKGWPLESVDVKINLERVKKDDYPDYTGPSEILHVVREKVEFGGPLSEEQLARLHEIAKKCPVQRVLESPTFFEEFEDVTEASSEA